eukprot:TRINITY_DN909_c0_g1_i1.p2 TRINITY_DN909_c0_g1~~TRINITY_DN909_c0_g1_i1.p2  ORF type:complete len:249 (-),score=144.30 TRINITY_DN909_c0_g1_i1:106-765(-)
MSFTLPALPYGYDALEPVIDERTMNIHHTKHHQAYITNANNALKNAPELAELPLIEMCKKVASFPDTVKTALRNNAGSHYNHSLFWICMAPPTTVAPGPVGELAAAIDAAFGSLDAFKEKFSAAALGRFGSGWAFLTVKPDGSLAVVSTPNQDNPLMTGIVPESDAGIPILTIDVWEHAYYLKFQNRRADFIKEWWSVVNWEAISRYYVEAKNEGKVPL